VRVCACCVCERFGVARPTCLLSARPAIRRDGRPLRFQQAPRSAGCPGPSSETTMQRRPTPSGIPRDHHPRCRTATATAVTTRRRGRPGAAISSPLDHRPRCRVATAVTTRLTWRGRPALLMRAVVLWAARGRAATRCRLLRGRREGTAGAEARRPRCLRPIWTVWRGSKRECTVHTCTRAFGRGGVSMHSRWMCGMQDCVRARTCRRQRHVQHSDHALCVDGSDRRRCCLVGQGWGRWGEGRGLPCRLTRLVSAHSNQAGLWWSSIVPLSLCCNPSFHAATHARTLHAPSTHPLQHCTPAPLQHYTPTSLLRPPTSSPEVRGVMVVVVCTCSTWPEPPVDRACRECGVWS
jgi:hypothetical protein